MTKPWIILALLAHGCAASSIKIQPAYTGMYKNGSILTLQCTGFGPSEDLSRKSALDSCIQAAGDAASSDMETRSLLVETNRSGVYHSEVSRNYSVSGLECLKMKSKTNLEDGSYLTHTFCDFDLAKAKFISIIANRIPTYVHGENRRAILSTIPPCQDILITGEKVTRTVSCEHNPITIFIKPGDQEIIIRGKDRFPRHIPISELSETMEVYLERM